MEKSRFRNHVTPAAAPVWIESVWFGPQILSVMNPVCRGDHKGPPLDGDTFNSAVLAAAAYEPEDGRGEEEWGE